MSSDVTNLADHLGYPRILVIGDAMLDRYTWGQAERVSPEAPVLVLRTDEREVRLGGAASVAMLLAALEAHVSLASVIGDDHDGQTLRRLLDEAGVDTAHVLTDSDRPTTTKERFLGRADHRQPHQMLRVDSESRDPIPDQLAAEMIQRFIAQVGSDKPALEQYDAVLISDYGKGVCTVELLTQIITLCRDASIPILIDPARGVPFDTYRQATLIKPNRLEAELVLDHKIDSPATAIQAALQLRDRFQIDCVVITLDQDGLVFATSDSTHHLPVASQAICDITGAGDTVLTVLGLGLAKTHTDTLKNRGKQSRRQQDFTRTTSPRTPVRSSERTSFVEIAQLANQAAGIQVAHAGVTPITRRQLQAVTVVPPNQHALPKARSPTKLVTLETAAKLTAEYHSAGKTVVFTNGCFDLLHVGHVSMLEESARLGDVLFVAINTDASVCRIKGAGRPVIAERDRARMLAALACVDHVLIFDEATPHRLLETLRPNVLAKGGTTSEIVGHEVVERYGGTVQRTGVRPGLSTTALVSQIQDSLVSLNSTMEAS